MEPEELVRIAHGEQEADLLLRNARLVNVYSGEIYLTDIAIAGEQVAALGVGYQARRPSICTGATSARG
jgi:adenine deaminase